MHQVLYAHLVTAPEPAPVSRSVPVCNVWVPEFIAIPDIRRAMVFRILASALNAVMKSLLFGAS
jgi:hypothetical protein